MTLQEYADRKSRRSGRTAEIYASGVRLWASTLGFATADEAVAAIKSGKLDVYKALDDFVGHGMHVGMAPKTILTYLSGVKGFLRHEDVTIDQYRLRDKVTLPAKVDVSIDRIPTREEVKKLLLEADLKLKAVIATLASSGMRIGELCTLRIGNVDFQRNPVRITISGKHTKTRQTRIVRITDETANLLKEYLDGRMDEKDAWVFPSQTNSTQPHSKNALHMSIMRLIERCGLLAKLDPESRRYALHPHCFRKYFFTQMIAAGIDRGIAEHFMGHKFGLDTNYLRLSDEALDQEYRRASDRLTFLSDISPKSQELNNIVRENEELRERLARLEGQFETILKTRLTSSDAVTL